MMDSIGRLFRITISGESHGPGIGIAIDGCPAGIPLSPEDFKEDLERRKPGAKGTTARREPDIPQLKSGILNGKTTGDQIRIFFENQDTRSSDYEKISDTPRPGHADFVANIKYKGQHDYRGGGQFSGRMTVAIVAAGAIAKKIIAPAKAEAKLLEAGGSKDIENAVEAAIREGDSVGGIIECRVNGLPIGLGEPFFDSAESMISHMIFSIPAIKGIEFGAGFKCASMKGSECNDEIIDRQGRTATNNAGGINGGITNGNELVFRVAVKPTPSISKPQKTVDLKTGKQVELRIEGRHDACIALRVPVIIEAAAAIALADLLMIERR